MIGGLGQDEQLEYAAGDYHRAVTLAALEEEDAAAAAELAGAETAYQAAQDRLDAATSRLAGIRQARRALARYLRSRA